MDFGIDISGDVNVGGDPEVVGTSCLVQSVSTSTDPKIGAYNAAEAGKVKSDVHRVNRCTTIFRYP